MTKYLIVGCLISSLAGSPSAFGIEPSEQVRAIEQTEAGETGNRQKQSQPAGRSKPVRKPVSYDPAVPTPTFSSVRYGDHERQVLDFWQAQSDEPTPLVFVIHGGGWMGGSKERVQRFADVGRLMAAGISVAAINYRFVSHGVADGVKPPVKVPLHDAARALQFVRSKADDWNVAKDHVGAAGGSAGACSSLWLAFHDEMADPNSTEAGWSK